MTAIIPAHRDGTADVQVLSAQLATSAYLAAELSDADDLGGVAARDLHQWALGALAEIGAQVGRGRLDAHAAAPFTDAELADPHLLDDFAQRRRAAVAAFDAEMLSQGVDPADLPALREHYQPAAFIIGAFTDRLIATLCALEARCRAAAAPQPAAIAAPARDLTAFAATILAALVLVALRTGAASRRTHPLARLDATAAQAVSLTRAARAPGAPASA